MAVDYVKRSSAAYRAAQQTISRQAVAVVDRAWKRVDRADIDRSWAAVRGAVVDAVAAGQARSAAAVPLLSDRVLAAEGLHPDPLDTVSPLAFAGYTADGVDLGTVLDSSTTYAKLGIARGQSPADALAAAQRRLDLITATEIADAGRGAMDAQLRLDPQFIGYERHVKVPCCSRCLILAGRIYKTNEGFLRHPQCLPAGVTASGPAVDAATRRWYEGELVIISTASGKRLPITGNHPVLTDAGWVPANLVQEGDYAIRSVLSHGAAPLVVPDEHQVPALVEDVWRAGGVRPLHRVPATAEDFHGDGGHGEVDVVLADRLLRLRPQSSLMQPAVHHLLGWGVEGSTHLQTERALTQELFGALRSSGCSVGGSSLLASLVLGELAGPQLAGSRHPADLYPGGLQSTSDHVAAYAEAIRQLEFASSVGVVRSEGVDRQDLLAPRWDAPPGPFTHENGAAYASRGRDLGHRLAGQVERDRVVYVERIRFAGHVYNLTSSEGWFAANDLIVSNCDCFHVPVTSRNQHPEQEPSALFHSLTDAQQDAAFTPEGARAIRDGASISSVVNARWRGGVRGKTAGMSRPGDPYTTVRARGAKGRRLSPQGVALKAGDDTKLYRQLLREHGYIR